MTTHRAEKLGETIRNILARMVLEELRDPRIGFVTLTEVRVSPDLRHARVFVSRLGDPAERTATVVALNRAAPFLRRALAREANLRRTPNLQFLEDTTMESGFRVEHLLDEIRRDQVPSPEEGADPSGDTE